MQLGLDGKSFKAVSIAVAPGLPQSAVSGEMTAVQLLGVVLARGRPDGRPHDAGSIANRADCAAIIATFRRFRGGRGDRHFPFAGTYRGAGVELIGEMLKVAAHVYEEDARQQGWHTHWRGNQLADEFAGRARPALTDPPRPWVLDRRVRHKLPDQLLGSLQPEELWRDMFSRRPAVPRARALAEPEGAVHLPVFTGTGWACGRCGVAGRSFEGIAGGSCSGRLVAAAAAF